MQCDRCGERLIEIDRYGERLTGCIECNRWSSNRSPFVVDYPSKISSRFETREHAKVGKRVQFESLAAIVALSAMIRLA
jgi:hypothetical protein